MRAAQVAVCGASPRALRLWQGFFFASVLFHHSNLRLPPRFEERLMRVLTTPQIHGIHHSAIRRETGSNGSSVISLWDWLHGTIRAGTPQGTIVIGVGNCRDPGGDQVELLLRLPFLEQRDAWGGGSTSGGHR